eukprot:scaffold12909_cov133-Skeletonema_marinoi.AAC.9
MESKEGSCSAQQTVRELFYGNKYENIEQSASAASASNYEGIEIVARDNRADVDPETGVQSEGGDGSANTATAFPSPRHGYYRKSKYAGAVTVLTLLVAAGTGVRSGGRKVSMAMERVPSIYLWRLLNLALPVAAAAAAAVF